MGDAALMEHAKQYYAAKFNHMPENAKIVHQEGNSVTVRLSDNREDGDFYLSEIVIDRVTRMGTDESGSFQITEDHSKKSHWEPSSDVYQLVQDSTEAAVLYVCSQRKPEETIDVQNVLKYFVDNSDAAKKYPFLKDIPEQNVIFTDRGSELWVIIPKNPDSTITVWEKDPATDKTKHRLAETCYGTPIILLCNYSDIASDVSVQVNPVGGAKGTQFAPYISMKDGEPTATNESKITVLK